MKQKTELVSWRTGTKILPDRATKCKKTEKELREMKGAGRQHEKKIYIVRTTEK